MRTFVKPLLAVGAWALVAGGALGQASAAPKKPANYPTRPITVMVCYGKGGDSAQSVRALRGPAEKIMGVKINMVNKPGGAGLNCLPDFAQTPADGYTILQHIDALTSKYVDGSIDLNPITDLEPLLIMKVAPTGLYIKGDDDRFQTGGKPDWDKVVAYAKANPGRMIVSNINISMETVTMAVVAKHFGIKVKQVFFDKPAQRYGAVIGGKLDILMEQPGDVSKHVQAGTLRPILSVWPERFSTAPDTASTGADYGLEWKSAAAFPRPVYEKGNAAGDCRIPGRGVRGIVELRRAPGLHQAQEPGHRELVPQPRRDPGRCWRPPSRTTPRCSRKWG